MKDIESYDYKFAEKIIPIPIDHRYGIEDMKFIVEEIKKIILE